MFCFLHSRSLSLTMFSLQETYKVGGGLIWTQAPFGYSMALIIGICLKLNSLRIFHDLVQSLDNEFFQPAPFMPEK